MHDYKQRHHYREMQNKYKLLERHNNHKKNKTEKMIKRNAVTTKRHKLMPMRQNCKDTQKTT